MTDKLISAYLVQTLRKLLYQIKTMIYSDLRTEVRKKKKNRVRNENHEYCLK